MKRTATPVNPAMTKIRFEPLPSNVIGAEGGMNTPSDATGGCGGALRGVSWMMRGEETARIGTSSTVVREAGDMVCIVDNAVLVSAR